MRNGISHPEAPQAFTDHDLSAEIAQIYGMLMEANREHNDARYDILDAHLQGLRRERMARLRADIAVIV